MLPGRPPFCGEMQGDLPAVISGPAFDKPIRNQPVDKSNRPRMRSAEDPPELVVGHARAIPDDDESGRRFTAVARDVARALLDSIHHGERKRP